MIRPMQGSEATLRRGRNVAIVRWGLTVTLALLFFGAAARGDSEYRFTDAHRVVVFADVHGAYTELLSVLSETGIIDDAQHWRGGESHLVSTGDLIDRGPGSRQVLDLLMRLEQEAQKAGGAVHVLLGNHEVMNLVGDLRYVPAAEFASFAGPEDTKLREDSLAACARAGTRRGAGRIRCGVSGWLLRAPPGFLASRSVRPLAAGQALRDHGQ